MRRPRPGALLLAAALIAGGCHRGGAQVSAPRRTAAADWPTYHRDATRSGAGPGLDGAALPGDGTLAPAWGSEPVDGDIYGEPLVVGGTVIVATENDTVYAFALSDGHRLWTADLGTPVDATKLACGNIRPVTGITATPVVDPAAGVVYVAAFLASGPGTGYHELFALRLTDGTVLWHRSADAPGTDPRFEQQRAALLLSRATVYVAYGGLAGDCGTYHGAVVGIPASGNGDQLSYVVPAGNEAGIWTPSGPAADADGNVFVTTGNSASTGGFDYGNAVIKLTSDLHQLSFFAPVEWAALNATDTDLGSLGPTILSRDDIFQIGKSGVGYTLRSDDLGGVGGQVASAQICSGAFGGTAYVAPVVYVPCLSELVAVLALPPGGLAVDWRAGSLSPGPPIVAFGLVWTIDLARPALVGLDPADGAVRARAEVPAVAHFATPTPAAGGRMLVAGLRTVVAFDIGGTRPGS